MAAWHEFRSMGCAVVVGGATRRERRAIEQLFAGRERIFSRFLPGSELNRVNQSAGHPTRVSPIFAELMRLALEARRETVGLVDPTLGAHLEATGYDRDFSQLRDRGSPVATPGPAGGAIRIDGTIVHVPAAVRLDLNGVVKSRTVDDALSLITGEGFVSAGGDIASHGEISVALPGGGTVGLVRGALATSGNDRRRWVQAGRVQHHLLDPRTGTPSLSPWSQTTVCGATCLGADVAAKAAFLLGPGGPAWLDARGLAGRFRTPDGSIVVNRSWQRSVEVMVPCT
jgi:FAD:protein FMN transferase